MTSGGPLNDHASNDGPETYRIGTLAYTKAGLFSVIGWMLWGGVVFTLVEAIFPQSMPLQLFRLKVPPGLTAILMTFMTQGINLLLVVPVGYRSDRTRTRWGRRIPFIVGSMPLVFISLAALGFTDDIGRALNHAGWPARLHLSAMVPIVLIVGIMITTFDISNVFVNSMYDYLVVDVIPQAVLARYMATARTAGQLATIIFNFFILGQIEKHTRAIYVGAAILYLVGFGTMCLKVREGRYPAPHDYRKRQSIFTSIRTFFRESFTHPLYISLYVASGVWSASYGCNVYRTIFYREIVGFDLYDIGKVKGWSGIASLFIGLPIGWLVDKIHPMRAIIISVLLTTPFTFASFYMPNFTWFWVIAACTLPTDILFDCSDAPLRMRIFPRAQYGQFAAANSFFRTIPVLVGSVVGGVFMSHMIAVHGLQGYRYCFIWQGFFSTLALGCLLVVYFYWKKYGDTSQTNAEDLLPPATPAANA